MAATKSDRITQALAIAAQYGATDGAHHKAWVIDQMVRALTGESKEYQRFIRDVTDGCESCGASGTEWDEGIPP